MRNKIKGRGNRIGQRKYSDHDVALTPVKGMSRESRIGQGGLYADLDYVLISLEVWKC